MTKPKRKEGHLAVALSARGEVILGVPRPGDIVMTAEQARTLASLLLEKACEAEDRGDPMGKWN